MNSRALSPALIPPPVDAAVVKASVLAQGERRFDAENYLSDGYIARSRIERLAGTQLERLARVWQPGRLKGVQVSREKGKPFLAATQVFNIRPTPRKWLSLPHTPEADERFVKHGWILVTRSGMVGDAIMAYRPLDGVIISDDLLRVVPFQSAYTGYIYSYLRTSYARSMLRSTKYGNVIKHLEPEHLHDVPILNVSDSLKATLNDTIDRCFRLRDDSYDLMLSAEALLSDAVGQVEVEKTEFGFSVSSRDLMRRSRRLDAYSHNPLAAAIIRAFAKRRLTTEPLENVANRVWWETRFKRVFGDNGAPYLSAEELFSVNPPVSKRVILAQNNRADNFFVKAGWIVMACSGQIYGLNGNVSLMTKAHESSFLSHDLIRIIPDTAKISPAYLYVALGHPTLGRPLVLRMSYGTSIPHLDPVDARSIPIVRLTPELEKAIAYKAQRSVELRYIADYLENAAVGLLESVIAQALGDAKADAVDAAMARLRLIEIEAEPKNLIQGKALGTRLAHIEA